MSMGILHLQRVITVSSLMERQILRGDKLILEHIGLLRGTDFEVGNILYAKPEDLRPPFDSTKVQITIAAINAMHDIQQYEARIYRGQSMTSELGKTFAAARFNRLFP